MKNTNHTLQAIYDKIRAQERISPEEGLLLYQKAPWLEIVQLAWERRVQQVGSTSASYTVFRIINYTNICSISCSFCSFKKDPSASGTYVLNRDEIFEKIENAISQKADQVFFQGGVNPELPLGYYTDLLQEIKTRFGIHIRGFSPVEIKHLADNNSMSIPEVIKTLKDSGLDSVPGAGAEILSERVRKVLAPKKCTTQEWLDIMKLCHQAGLRGSANIVIGSIETDEEILEHLCHIRNLQDETKGFDSFIPWTFQAQTKEFTHRKIMHHEYLKLVGLSRLFLDNIKNIEVSVMVLGKEIGKLALRMGANDISSPVIEENVLRSFGVKSEAESRNLIKEAGFNPLRRGFNYQVIS